MTNRSIDGLSLTGYAKKSEERNQDAPFFIGDGTEVVPAGQADAGLDRLEHPWNFDKQSYPITASAWYAPTQKWSVSGGYAYFSNWISQDITLGDQTDRWVDKGTYWRHYLDPATTRWDYDGTSQVVNLGSSYAYTRHFSLMGNLEWTRSDNSFNSPSPAAYDLAGAGATPGVDDFVVTPTGPTCRASPT